MVKRTVMQNDRILPILRFFDKLDRIFLTTGWIAGGLAFIMMLALVREVVGRYFFNAPTDWAIDISAFLLVVMVYLGSAYTTSIDGHVKADFFYRHLKGGRKNIVDIFIYCVCICYAAILVWQGGIMAYESYIYAEVSSGGIRVLLYPFQAFVPIGSFLVALCFTAKIIRSLTELFGRKQ